MDPEAAQISTISEQIKLNGATTTATLSTDGKIRWKTGKDERCLSLDEEVLGFVVEGSKIRVKAFVLRERWLSCQGGHGHRVRKDFVLEPLNEESLRVWCGKLKDWIDSFGRPRRLFIVVNPFGGKKCGMKVFNSEVKPLLTATDVQYTLQETKYQLHAKELAHSLDLSKYDGIVCVSGDGVLVEVVNGLLQRDDWDAAIKMPLGVVPAGTGNGMVKSILDSVDDPCTAPNAIFAVIRGRKRALDVATVLQGEIRFFSVLMLTWGLVADIDIESEKYRWMGSSRIDFYSILRILQLRKYQGRVYFVPAPGYEAHGNPINHNGTSSDNLIIPSHHRKESVQSGYQGPATNFDNREWRTIEGPFISVWIHNVPWASEGVMPAPDAKFSDGYLDLIIIRGCPKSSLLALMTKLSDGSHVKSSHVLYLKVKAFQLHPGQRIDEPNKGGIIDSDGEVLARGEGTYKSRRKDLMAYGPPIHMTVDNGLATLFAPR